MSGAALVRLDAGTPVRYPLADSATIGRLDTCDIPVNEKAVSREHARINRVGRGYVIEDLGSTNGTRVNGERITGPVSLQPGDVIRVGRVELRYEATAVPDRSSLPFPRRKGRARPEEITSNRTSNSPISRPAERQRAVSAALDQHTNSVPIEARTMPRAGAEGRPAAGQPALIEEPTGTEPEAVQAGIEDEPYLAVPAQAETLGRGQEIIPEGTSSEAAAVDSEPTGAAQAALDAARGLIPLLERLTSAPGMPLDTSVRVRQILAENQLRVLPRDQITGLQELLDELLLRPRDIDTLARLSREAATMALVVQEYGRACRLLHLLNDELQDV